MTTTALEVISFTEEQVGLIKATICPDYTDNELALFLAYSKSIGANPLAREVHTWKQDGKVIFCRGIDWLRRTAMEASNRCYAPGGVTIQMEGDKIVSATAKVKRWYPDAKCWMEHEAVAWFSECSKGNSMWRQRPRSQLAKCAEALALRQAFPEYIPTGMGISDGNDLLVPPESYPDAIDIPPEDFSEVDEKPLTNDQGQTNLTELKRSLHDAEPQRRGRGRPRKDATPPPTPPPVAPPEAPKAAEPTPPARPVAPGGALGRLLLAEGKELGVDADLSRLKQDLDLHRIPFESWTPDDVAKFRAAMHERAETKKAATPPPAQEF